MGLVQRYGLDRLRNVMGYSRQHTTICMTPAESGWRAGVGKLLGPDPREMAESDLIVVWGANPVSTQVNVMTHVAKARKTRGAKLVVVDVYRTPTVEQADVALIVNPGSDGALALAVMHVLLSEGMVDRDYLAQLHRLRRRDRSAYQDPHAGVGRRRSPASRSRQIVAFARLYGRPEAAISASASASRARATAPPPCTPSPACRRSLARGATRAAAPSSSPSTRPCGASTPRACTASMRSIPRCAMLDQSRIGAVLCGDAEALNGGPPVMAHDHAERQLGDGRTRHGDRCSAASRARISSWSCRSSS